MSRDPKKEVLLDIKAPMPRGEVHCVAICEQCVIRRDVNKKPFIKYVFRDSKGRRITGRKFDVTDMNKAAVNLKESRDNVVLINGRLDFFGKIYISVDQCTPVSKELSQTVRSVFFNRTIDNYEKELSILNASCTALLSEDLAELIKCLGVMEKLSNSINMDISDGLRGSSVMLVNTFNNSLAQITGKQGRLLMVSNMIVEAMLTSSRFDPAEVLNCWSNLSSIIAQDINVERRKILEIVTSSIYLYFGFEQDTYSADALIVNTVREFVYNITKQKEYIQESLGIFAYDGYTVVRGEI